MSDARVVDIKKPRGRPKANSKAILVRVPPEMAAALDKFTDEELGIRHPEVIRDILRQWLTDNGALGAS